MSTPTSPRDPHASLKVHAGLSVVLIAIGFALLVMMIVVESEPGALPLLMLFVGIGWYVVTRLRLRARHT